tara:strand:+ start:1223 stop:1408 length:186 start_codon:yes stop_codon:yes gene_type:complete
MDEMNITSAQYFNDLDGNATSIKLVLDNGEMWSVPVFAGNRHYDEILAQVEAGTLTIQEAD